jgi:YVTN family beta-propeller protein
MNCPFRWLRLLRLAGSLLLITCQLCGASSANELTSSILDADDIMIPVFDSQLGTLNSVALSITVRPGNTQNGVPHDHATYPVTSLNTIETASVAPFTPFSFGAEPTSSTSHFAISPPYSGAGLDIGQFNLSLSTAGLHGHATTISFAGLQQVGFSDYRAVVNVDSAIDSGHSHSYNPSVRSRVFSGAEEVSPFLAASNIVIPAGAFSVQPDSAHTHFLPSFSQTLSTAAGLRTLFFPATQLPFVAGHAHQIDPRFDVSVTFTYDPVTSEPPTLSGTVYVANSGSDTVSIVSLSALHVVNTISVGENPRYVAFNPNGTRAYVTNSGSDSVSVIDTSLQTVVSTINVGGHPEQIVVTRDGTRAYVANSSASSVSVIDLVTNSIVDTLTTAVSPTTLALHPIRDELWIGFADTGTLLEARSLSDHSVLGTATGFSRIYASGDLAFWPDGDAALGSENCGVCGRFHKVSGDLMGTTITAIENDILYDNQGAARGVAINPITDVAYLAKLGQNGGANRIVEFGGAGRTLLTGNPFEMEVSADGAFLFLTQGDGSIAVIDTATFSIVDTIPVGMRPHGFAIQPLPVIPGDFNGDGNVDGRDFLQWQRGASPNALSASDLTDWHANYGTAAATATTAVPEPNALAVLVAATIVVAAAWRSRLGSVEQSY